MRIHPALLLLAVAACTAARAQTLNQAGIARLNADVQILGDQDGFFDTNESGELHLSLFNKGPFAYAYFDVRLTALDGKINALWPSLFHVPFLAAGATATFVTQIHISASADRAGAGVVCLDRGPSGRCSNFVEVPGGCISDASCRLTAAEEYSTGVALEIIGALTPVPDRFVFDLDLDVAQPAQATSSFVEGFESGLGAFALQNLDAGIASNSASNGSRCQYNDPDYPNSNSYASTDCYLGFSAGQNPVNDWHRHSTAAPDAGRAYEGSASLHYGKHTGGSPALDSISLSQLDAIRTSAGLNLAARVCANDAAVNPRACNSDADCAGPGGGPCVPARPELSFKHQAAIAYWFCGRQLSGGVVAARPAGSLVWDKVYPYENVYDDQRLDYFTNCGFDPTDDGNDEDDYFAPGDPARHLGPSSTCYPEFVFTWIGETGSPYAPANVGGASHGPALAGALGTGTWVESKFDLARYRGRTVNLRFLVTTVKVGEYATWRQLYGVNLACDDGWYIDDVRVTETLGAVVPTATPDDAPNDTLPGATDSDGDGVPDDFDCAPADPGAFHAPAEVLGLRPAGVTATFEWEAAQSFFGGGTVHDLLRGILRQWPVGSGVEETCVTSTGAAQASDATVPQQGAGFYYLVGARNACGSGPYGYQSNGSPRVSAACP